MVFMEGGGAANQHLNIVLHSGSLRFSYTNMKLQCLKLNYVTKCFTSNGAINFSTNGVLLYTQFYIFLFRWKAVSKLLNQFFDQ